MRELQEGGREEKMTDGKQYRKIKYKGKDDKEKKVCERHG